MVEELKFFCKHPSKKNFENIPELFRRILDVVAEYAIDTMHDNIDMALRIHKYFTALKIHEYRKPGLRALFLAMKLLKTPEFEKLRKHQKGYPNVVVKLNEKNIDIAFQSELDGMFFIRETFGKAIEKELNMYEDNTKQYILDLFVNDPSLEVQHIDVELDDKNIREFYDSKIGLVWSNEECVKCLRKLANGGVNKKSFEYKRCEKIIKTCADKIRFRPELDNVAQHKSAAFKPVTPGQHGKTWDCAVCLLENPNDRDTCAACEAHKV